MKIPWPVWRNIRTAVTAAAAVLATGTALLAQDAKSGQAQDTVRARATLGSPDQVDNQLATDAKPNDPLVSFGFLDGYFGFKDRLKESSGLGFGIDYTSVYFGASSSPGEDEAGSGILRLFGSWELVGRESGNTGAFVYKIEHRHAYTDVTPKFLSFNLGYAGIFAAPYNDDELRVTNLYWRQSLGKGRVVLLGGFLDATDYVDIFGLGSPWLHFMNLAFSTGSAAIDLPNDAALGVGAGHLFGNNMYVVGSVVDRNADPTDIGEGFDTFFSDKEYFTSIEVGHTSSHSRIALDNIHLTLWHADARKKLGAPSGWGANFSWSRYFNNQIMPFVRAGYTEDSGSLLSKSVSAGFGFRPDPGTSAPGDLFGAAVNWGEVNELSFDKGLDDQYTLELFYRWQLTPRFALTGDYQYLRDPALNPLEDSIHVFAVRGRFAL